MRISDWSSDVCSSDLVSHLLLLVSLLVAAGVGYLAGRHRQTGIGNVLSDMVLVGLVIGRIAFVAIWFEQYRQAPWSVLDIRDGGFTPWAGLVAALLMAIWRGRQIGSATGRERVCTYG